MALENDILRLLKDRQSIQNALPFEITLGEEFITGGQAVVYIGEFQSQKAAIKIYSPNQDTERINREISAMQTLNCPCIARILSNNVILLGDKKCQVLTTEYIEGQNLSDSLKVNVLNYSELDLLLHDIALAINSLWNMRIVHRDIKPSNIIRRKTQGFCLIDLGVARHIDRTDLTNLGATWGTFGYLSPEQCDAQRQLTCKSDIYSLAVVLIEASLGKHPTDRDQRRLLTLQLSDLTSSYLRDWDKYYLLDNMLSRLPFSRPTPVDILKQYYGEE